MPAIRTWLKNPLAVFTANDLDARGGLVIENGVITELLASGQSPYSSCTHVFDAREHVLLPGLINTHHHFYQTLTRAWAPVVNQPLFPWLKTLYPVWARLTPEKLALATKVAPGWPWPWLVPWLCRPPQRPAIWYGICAVFLALFRAAFPVWRAVFQHQPRLGNKRFPNARAGCPKVVGVSATEYLQASWWPTWFTSWLT